MNDSAPVGPEKWLDVIDVDGDMGLIHGAEGDFLGGPCQRITVEKVQYIGPDVPLGLRVMARLAVMLGHPYKRYRVLPSGRLGPPNLCYLLGHVLFLWPDD